MEELDAAALLFLDEFAVDGHQDRREAEGVHASHDDTGLLSSLLASPASSAFELEEFNPFFDGDSVSGLASPVQLSFEALESSDSRLGSPSTNASTQNGRTRRTRKDSPLPVKRKQPKRPASYQPNRARNARRHELVDLKRTIAEMEQQLERLRDTKKDAAAAANTVALSTPSLNPGVWERVAARQLSERRRAERENERLKDRLQTQLKIARSLEHSIRKRAITEGIVESGLGRQRRVTANTSLGSDELLFEELLNQVHRVYLDAESHFERMGISSTEMSCQDTRRRARTKNALEVEIFANEVLPFELSKVGKAAWQYFSNDKNYLPYRFHYERLREKSNLMEHTIIENSGLEIYANSVKYVFNVKQALRRYIEPDRVVVAFTSIAQPVEFANKPVQGCQFREYGCMVLKRPAIHDPKTHTVMQSCFFITPELHGGTLDDRMMQELTDFNVESTAATMAAWLQMIENILVTDHLASVQQ